MKPFVRQGDALHEFGGEVLTGHYLCEGLPIACVGDAVRCNLHGVNQISQGSELVLIDGMPAALDGHRCACGCALVSSLPDTLAES